MAFFRMFPKVIFGAIFISEVQFWSVVNLPFDLNLLQDFG